MTSLLVELKRRNVYKVAFAYLILGWVILQITDVVAPALRLPDWTMSLVTYLGLIGFPFALLFTWAFELTPEGLRRSTEVDPSRSITGKTGQTLNGIIITMLVLAVALLLADRFMVDGKPAANSITAGKAFDQPKRMQADAATASDKPRSIAVLPFVNMSNDPDQEYFADGISEELLNVLAKISELQVAARTSSFAFKGQNQDITDIGKELKVETVLEGSVRKAGQRVRITAQLINVDDGYHLWSEVYDRELTDIFAIQDEISVAIVDALKVHLTDAEVARNTTSRQVDLDAYNTVLLARHNLRQRNKETLERAAFLFQKAIDIDPTYADAWAGKASAAALLSEEHYGETPPLESAREAQQLIDMALRLDADNADALATQALLDLNTKDADVALASLNKAIAANPSSGIMYSWRADALDRLGDYPAANRSMNKAYRMDPLHATIRRNRALMYAVDQQPEAAREILIPGERDYFEISALIARSQGQLAEGEQIISAGIGSVSGGEQTSLKSARNYYRYFWLGDIAGAQEGAPENVALTIDAYTNPARALTTIESLTADAYGDEAFHAHLIALAYLGRHADVISTFEDRYGKPTRVEGSLWTPLSRLEWLIEYASALKATGQVEPADQLILALQQYVAQSENGSPIVNLMVRKARIALLVNDASAAIAALKTGLQHHSLTTDVFAGPFFEDLRDNPEFLAIRESWLQHVNRERARLDRPPLELAAL